MLIKGTCQKQNLMQAIHDAILSPGSNWTEVSSNNVNDFNMNLGMGSDGWVFKSPAIGTKAQNIFLTIKSQDFSLAYSSIILFCFSENYAPSATLGQNGTHVNKNGTQWQMCNSSTGADSNFLPTDTIEYFIDILDHRILIVIQKKSVTLSNYPQYIYLGYPDLKTNLEGTNINQLMFGSNLTQTTTANMCFWFKNSNSTNPYWKYATTSVNLNSNNPTPMGLYLMSPAYISGDGVTIPNFGLIGVLEGIYFLPATNVINGDILQVGSDQYQIFNLAQWTLRSSVQSTIIAIKISN